VREAWSEFRFWIAETLLGWALRVFPRHSREQLELAAFLYRYMVQRLKPLPTIVSDDMETLNRKLGIGSLLGERDGR
jgi:hypothetical protein